MCSGCNATPRGVRRHHRVGEDRREAPSKAGPISHTRSCPPGSLDTWKRYLIFCGSGLSGMLVDLDLFHLLHTRTGCPLEAAKVVADVPLRYDASRGFWVFLLMAIYPGNLFLQFSYSKMPKFRVGESATKTRPIRPGRPRVVAAHP